MSKILKFSDYINEAYKTENDFAVGDEVFIIYDLTGDITPVKIIKKKTQNYFIVSFKVKDGQLQNAPDKGIKKSEIIGRYQGNGDPINTTDRYAENPNIQPNVSGMVPGWDSWHNDVSF